MTTKKTKKSAKKNYTYAVGRRRRATARVRLFKGRGETIVNGLPIDQYFPGELNKIKYLKPLAVTNLVDKYYATVKVEGSGKMGQLDAVAHGLARALNEVDREAYRPALKKHGLLTRDPRRRERRKAGQMGRARKKKQSPKR
jgi:small subunit ribosomal protein S9